MKKFSFLFSFLSFVVGLTVFSFSTPHSTSPQAPRKQGGFYSHLNLEISPLTKDAMLLGVTQAEIQKALEARFRKHNINVEKREKTRGIFSTKISTMDVEQQIVSYVHVKLLEVARLPRMRNRRFVVTWDAGKLTASHAVKHPQSIKTAINELVDAFMRASLK